MHRSVRFSTAKLLVLALLGIFACTIIVVACGEPTPSVNSPQEQATLSEDVEAPTFKKKPTSLEDIEMVDVSKLSPQELAEHKKRLARYYNREKKKLARLVLIHEQLCNEVVFLRDRCILTAPLSSTFLKASTCKKQHVVKQHDLRVALSGDTRSFKLLVNNEYSSGSFRAPGGKIDFSGVKGEVGKWALRDIQSLHLVLGGGGSVQASEIGAMRFDLTFGGYKVLSVSGDGLSVDEGKIKIDTSAMEKKSQSPDCNPHLKTIMTRVESEVDAELKKAQ